MADVTSALARGPLTGSVAVPTSGASALDVYVNGRLLSTAPVSSGSASISIPAAQLVPGVTNLIGFIAKNASGGELAKNVAVVVATLPEVVAEADGGHDVPIAWLSDAWTDLAAAGSTAARPVSYDDYLAFATNASPIGKSVPLWQDYVAGTAPTDVDEIFSATITMTNDTAYISWRPDRPDLRATRVYTLKGATSLTGPWATEDATNPSAEIRQTNNFFKVTVELP